MTNYQYHSTLIVVLTTLSSGIISTSSAYKVEMIPSSPRSVIGEGPHWDAGSQSLYYVDIYGTECTILRYCPAEDRVYCANIIDEPFVTFIIPVAGRSNEFAVGLVHTVGIIRWDGKSPLAKVVRIALTVELEAKYKNNRFNDAKADPYGRLFAGTKREEGCKDLVTPTYGNLYRVFAGQPSLLLQPPYNVRISNGLAWDEWINKFYYPDSCAFNIKAYDYNPCTGDITNEQIVFNFTENGGQPNYDPDGMTIDNEGNVYVGTFGGSKIVMVNPRTGEKIKEIIFPATQVTSAVFGGPHLNILYVTTAAQNTTITQLPQAGHLFRVLDLGVHGYKGVPAVV